MERCPNLDGKEKNFLDTTFENMLVDNGKCPTKSNEGRDSEYGYNQCIYQCREHSHLMKNNIDME
jgi:hypothetical protein